MLTLERPVESPAASDRLALAEVLEGNAAVTSAGAVDTDMLEPLLDEIPLLVGVRAEGAGVKITLPVQGGTAAAP